MSTDFESLIFDYLTAALSASYPGVLIVRSEQGGPRPPEYVTYKVLPKVPSAFDGYEKVQSEEDEDFITVTHRNRGRVTVSIQAYSEDGEDILNKARYGTKAWAPRRILMNSGASLLSGGIVRDTTFLGDTGYRRRYTVELTFLAWTEYVEERPKVKEITASGEIRLDEQEEV